MSEHNSHPYLFLKEILIQEGFNDGRYFSYSEVMELEKVYERFEQLYDEMKWGPPRKEFYKRRKAIYLQISCAWSTLKGAVPGEPQINPILDCVPGKGYKFLQWDDYEFLQWDDV